MRAILLILLAMPLAAIAQSPTPDPLNVTLPSGKVVHFESAEQKAKYETARERASRAAASTASNPEFDKVQERVNREREVRKAETALAQRSITLWLRIAQITPNGILATYTSGFRKIGGVRLDAPEPYEFSSEIIFVVCKPSASWVDGDEIRRSIYANGVHVYTSVSGAMKHIEKYQMNEQETR